MNSVRFRSKAIRRSYILSHIIRRDGKQCKGCKISLRHKDMHIDHVIPRCENGPDKISNMQILCKRCNLIKGAHTMEWLHEYIRSRVWCIGEDGLIQEVTQ